MSGEAISRVGDAALISSAAQAEACRARSLAISPVRDAVCGLRGP